MRGRSSNLVHCLSKYSTSKFEKTSLILEQFLIDIEKRAVFSYTKNCSGGYVVKHKIVNYSLTIDFFSLKFCRQVEYKII